MLPNAFARPLCESGTACRRPNAQTRPVRYKAHDSDSGNFSTKQMQSYFIELPFCYQTSGDLGLEWVSLLQWRYNHRTLLGCTAYF